jgi:hypothetical protein
VQILFIISILSLLAVVAVAAAIVHHVRSNRRQTTPSAPPEPSFGEHLYAAAEYGTPRSPRLVQHQKVQSITAQKEIDNASHSQKRSIGPMHRIANPLSQPHSFRVAAGTRIASSKRI